MESEERTDMSTTLEVQRGTSPSLKEVRSIVDTTRNFRQKTEIIYYGGQILNCHRFQTLPAC